MATKYFLRSFKYVKIIYLVIFILIHVFFIHLNECNPVETMNSSKQQSNLSIDLSQIRKRQEEDLKCQLSPDFKHAQTEISAEKEKKKKKKTTTTTNKKAKKTISKLKLNSNQKRCEQEEDFNGIVYFGFLVFFLLFITEIYWQFACIRNSQWLGKFKRF